MDIQNIVVNYYKSNQFIQKYFKGFNAESSEVLLELNGNQKILKVDELVNIKSEEELLALFNGNVNASVINPVAKEQTMLVDNVDLKKATLNDIKILTEIKNKEGLDNLLKKIAVNPSTGLIDINVAISTITRNTMNEVEKAINNGYDFNTDLSLYDIEGNYTGTPISGLVTEDEQIAKSFNNIKVYLDASKMYPEQVNYNEEQIKNFMKTYVEKVKEELHGKSVPAATPTNEQNQPVNPPVTPVPQNNIQQANTSAGFADIFVLTVIVLVYAIIIVNLILKLK